MTASPAVNWRQIGNGWASWSHGYTGDVYFSNGALSVTLTMPPGTTAFYLYVEPNPFAVWNITAITDGGVTSGLIPVDGNSGATGFAFYTDAADHIATIMVSSDVDFAVGEFGISDAYNLSFKDDKGRSQFCVSTSSGAYQWNILKGNGSISFYTGTLKVLNGGTLFTSIPDDPNQIYLVYDVLHHKANGYMYTMPQRLRAAAPIYSPLVDKNTRNDPPCDTDPFPDDSLDF